MSSTAGSGPENARKGSHRLCLVPRWPSLSLLLVRGDRRIRGKAHSLTTDRDAAQVMAALLGHLNEERVPPRGATAQAAEAST
ncbi:hypothetical protein [Streptomyces sp. NPDC058247]|uniref:hypothetical protein n=1 Tax=Streptomyces sp. NPDC058247 TaxID=3346401 RepID=UPI0036E0D0C6